MGRAIMYTIITVLGIFVLAATFLVESGGDSTATISTITVNDILSNPERWEGQEFATRGLLSYDEESGFYSISESGVDLRVVFEPGGIEEFVGEEVRVTGQVAVTADGVYVDADRVRPVER